ncbi:MAG TPA: hypothetical protein VGD37_02510 [Kofleriaceae bacterium]
MVGHAALGPRSSAHRHVDVSLAERAELPQVVHQRSLIAPAGG